ncbi:MAG TPA: hypothetical protein VF430_09930 [Verrucomicrobiae bacterium]
MVTYGQQCAKPTNNVFPLQTDDEVKVFGEPFVSVRHNRHSADDEVFDPGTVQRLHDGFDAADFHTLKTEIEKAESNKII